MSKTSPSVLDRVWPSRTPPSRRSDRTTCWSACCAPGSAAPTCTSRPARLALAGRVGITHTVDVRTTRLAQVQVSLGLPAEPFTVDWAHVVTRMLTLKGIYGREVFATWYEMAVLLERGLDISPVITDRFPVEQFEQAFAVARGARGGKVVLDWTTL